MDGKHVDGLGTEVALPWLVEPNVGSLGAEEAEALGSSHCEARGKGCRDISTNQQLW